MRGTDDAAGIEGSEVVGTVEGVWSGTVGPVEGAEPVWGSRC